ncbi:MAG TPA: creatininase family protein [Acetobacteraceae bacterium]|nr:creatininase family protein [Acetobacteraceae bacterium]
MKRRLAELTGGEARDVLARRPVILLPLGSHEEQGPHAPMGDYLSADRMAERIAARATEAGTETLVAPVLPFGGAEYFGSVPGGIALSQATLRAVLTDVFACLLRHGLSRLVVINGHGGNVGAIHETTLAIRRAQDVVIPSFYLWKIGKQLLPAIVGAERARASTGHGADPLSSVAMHLLPELVRPDLAPAPIAVPQTEGLPASGFGSLRFEGVDVEMPLELDAIAPDGVFGADARIPSAETGAALVERLTEIGARFVAHHAKHAP